jgi:mono/diheme cytochrome c family protein
MLYAARRGGFFAAEVPMRVLALIGALAIVVAVGAAVYFFGGFYSVAATEAEPAPVAWALVKVREASVGRHASEQPPASFNDQASVPAGARAFAARGCINCHGAPGMEWAKFSEGLRPDPPDLTKIVKDRTPAQLFWVVKNGIKMTGMPGFGATGVPDPEIWQIAAFLKKLPNVSEAEFKAWSEAK